MLVGLPRGRDWFRTLRVWREVCQALAEEVKDELAFQLLALPLTEFLAQPEWDEAISDRWEDLTRQAQQDAQGKSETDKQGLLAISRSRRRKPGDDYLLLSALLQRYQENVQDERPSAEFLPLMHLIYSASHPERREYWVEAGLPHASIYLLKQYLEAHPDLLKLLQQTTHRGRGRIRWGINTIFHRMQSVANVFLAYHGWRANGLLRVRATDQPDCGRDYGFHAEMSGQLPQFAWHQVTGTEFSSKQQYLLALTWVLWALFEYGEDLGLGTPEFW